MATIVKCSNGHNYDSKIYDKCPFCPTGSEEIATGGKTEIMDCASDTSSAPTVAFSAAASQETFTPGGTVIRGLPNQEIQEGRKLVGFLVSYDMDENGRAFKLYEGKNVVGSAPNCDIPVSTDASVSSKHLTILYRGNRFLFKDEFSTNGTFINGTMENEGVLKDRDVITVGKVRFLLIEIPEF